jgi:hypothetical protein
MQGPIVALVLAKGSNTVADWQELMGPEDVRKALASAPKRYVEVPSFLWRSNWSNADIVGLDRGGT